MKNHPPKRSRAWNMLEHTPHGYRDCTPSLSYLNRESLAVTEEGSRQKPAIATRDGLQKEHFYLQFPPEVL